MRQTSYVMSMNSLQQQIISRYVALSPQKQIVLLARVAERIAFHGRDAYGDKANVADIARLKAFNEAQNRILPQLVWLLTANQHRYPDEVFCNVLIEQLQVLRFDPLEVVEMIELI